MTRLFLLPLLLCLAWPAPAQDWAGATTTDGPVHADGTRLQIHIPRELHQKNTGGSDGAGLCVFASMRHAGLWQNDPVFAALFDWMKRHPGGSYPRKTDAMIERYCKEKGLPKPLYMQVEGKDLEILKLAVKTGRPPGITMGYLPGYRSRIAHMVSLVHAGPGGHWAVLDNNYPGRFAWMGQAEFLRSYTSHGQGWAIVLLSAPPPPAPKE